MKASLPAMVSAPSAAGGPGATPSTSRPWLGWAVPATILVLATAMRLLGLGKSLWLDEASSYVQATAPDFVAAARNYDHPPLYFALLRIGLDVTSSFTLLRLFSVACGVAAVAVFCVFFGGSHHTANWYAALLLGVLPGFVDNSQQLRQYALLTFSFTLSLMFAWRVVQTPRNGAALIGLSGVLAVAACTHLISSFFMLALAVVTLWSLRRQPWGRIVQVAVAFVPPALLAFFFKWVFLTQTDKSPDLWWMPPVSLDLLKDVFGEITGWGTLEDVADACNGYVVGCGPVFLAVAAVGIAFLVWTAWGRAAARVPRVLLTMALIYWALVIIYSLTVIQVVVPRTMLPGILPLLLGLGLGVSTHPRWHRRVIAGAVTTLLAVAIAIPWLSGLAVRPFDNLRGASYALKRNSHPPDLLVLVGEDWALEPYWPEYKERRVLRLELAAPLPDTLASLGAARAAQPSGSAVLLFYRHDSLSGARDHAVLDTIIEQLSADGATPENLWGGDYSILRFRPQLHS